jgi:regulator of sirC expression with transglutaminase-like and TPR domain
LRRLIETAKEDPGVFATMNPVQKKVYNLIIALQKRLCRTDDQQKEIKRFRSDVYTKEQAITKLSNFTHNAKTYEKRYESSLQN